jgi:predicted GNAT superfamily acetyltransferase
MTPAVIAEFEAIAGASAERAGVRIDVANGWDDALQVSQVLADVWGLPLRESPGEVGLLVVVGHGNGYVAGAWRGYRIVGGSFAFLTWHGDRLGLHSHVTGTVEPGGGVATAMKHHQRAWAAAMGIDEIVWTFDPLIRRNAHLNLEVLGGRVAGYERNLYGPLNDSFNANDETDRAFLHWDITRVSPRRPPIHSSDLPNHEVALDNVGVVHATTADHLLVGTPGDIIDLRSTDPAAALHWRQVQRSVLSEATSRGLSASRLTTDGYLVISPR